MDEQSLLEMERRFWLDGADHYRRFLDREALMLFPEPAGMMSGKAAIEALARAPRWREVRFADVHVLRPSDRALVLAYRARAYRDEAGAHVAFCSSVYRRSESGDWLLCLHQQTPAA